LFIAADQRPWLPDIEGDLRVSSLQTGCFAGPAESTIGQHRTNEELRVVEEQDTARLVTPTFAAIELRARWAPVAGQMVALWMIGFEDEPDRSAEICICEIFGDEADGDRALVGMGVHPFNDPAVEDDFTKVDAAIDVSDWHDYAAIWTPDDVTFFIDDQPVKQVEQSPQYPMQLMLNIYDFEPPSPDRSASPFQIDRIRVLQP
jgi:beta-glucanase (GH16 family)